MAYSLQTAIVRHILPKANEIVDTAQQNFKSIYPFELKKTKHTSSTIHPKNQNNFIYNKDNYLNLFKPTKKTVKQHFSIKHLIYDKFNNNFDEEIFNENIFSIEKLKNMRVNDFILNCQQIPQFSLKSQQIKLVFDSRFECGNLSFASKIEDQFYLLLHNDVNTSGYTNWFYFSIQPKVLGKYRLAILNFGKAGWPYGLGTGICYRIGNQWKRGGQNIFCQQNSKIFSQNDTFKKFNTLSFEFQFKSFQKVYFSYNIPYSYTDLLTTLDQIQRQNYPFYHRKLAGTTLCGNRIQMLTIGNSEKHRSSSPQQVPVIVLLARSHAGQSVSSWILHYFLKFLLSDHVQARILRDRYLFKIFPMINPDGVIHGNYRCSLIGRDLNRRWNKAIKQLYPEVYYVKNQILQLSERRNIRLVIDLHGHTQKRQAFFFGCNDRNQPHKCRLFPYLLSKLSQSYDFSSCNFCIDKSKLSTARITLYMLLKNCDVFTLETSQFGLKNQIFYPMLFKQVGQSLVKGIYLYFKLNKVEHLYRYIQQSKKQKQLKQRSLSKDQDFRQTKIKEQTIQQTIEEEQILYCELDTDKLQQQILQNNNLLKMGNQKDDGSDSEPSVCNINFLNLTKLCNRKDLKINSQMNRRLNKQKKSIKRVFVNRKEAQSSKKSIDLLPISSNNKLPLPKRFASTSHSFRKRSQDSSDFHNLTKTQKHPHKSESQRGISAISNANRSLKKPTTQQIVRMINFQLSFQGFNSHRSNMKRKFRSTNNQMLNSILDVRINNFVNYTQPSLSLSRPYSYLYKNKR